MWNPYYGWWFLFSLVTVGWCWKEILDVEKWPYVGCWMVVEQSNKIYCMISYKVITKANTKQDRNPFLFFCPLIRLILNFFFSLKALFERERFNCEFWSNIWNFQLVESLLQVVQNSKFYLSQVTHKEADKFQYKILLKYMNICGQICCFKYVNVKSLQHIQSGIKQTESLFVFSVISPNSIWKCG